MLELLSLFIFPFFGTLKSESYPNPLSIEEEQKYLIEMQNGSEKAREKLIEHNLRLVAHIAKRYENTSFEKDDVLSIGIIGLIKAIDSFNPNASNKLSTYAAKCIENEILMQLRRDKNKTNCIWLSTPIGKDKEGNEIELMDIVKDTNPLIIDKIETEEKNNKLYEMLKLLDSRELDIIKRRYGLFGTKEETQKEIATNLNISRSYVSRIEKRALLKLYLALNEK